MNCTPDALAVRLQALSCPFNPYPDLSGTLHGSEPAGQIAFKRLNNPNSLLIAHFNG